MTTDVVPTMDKLRPFWGCITVLESSVDEEQRQSGLIVPLSVESSGANLQRGVVLHVSAYDRYGDAMAHDLIGPGTVVYHRGGVRVADVVIVKLTDVVAYIEGS